MQRRLAAILAADVVDYTRLMGEDEAATLAALNQLRTEVFQPSIEAHQGSIIKHMGDGWLVEFPNVAEAVACAVAVQDAMNGHEIMSLRIGVHIGDVTFQEDDIYGDGINVASRLEAIASPGQVVISDLVHHSLDSKTANRFGAGEVAELKNISRPVQVWRWPDGAAEPIDTKNTRTSDLPLPDKPSIAVLPFDNMSGDPEQEYFADGITEDIITALSRNHALLVIARNSSFQYRGLSTDVRQIGKELGVRYLLEGSVRKAGVRIRVTAQLIETETGNHVWAERYDRELADIFDLQDELTVAICVKANAELANTERNIAQAKSNSNLNAWDHYQRGMWYYHKLPIEFHEARKQFLAAVEASPDFAMAHAWLAFLATIGLINNYFEDREVALEEGMVSARRAVALDDRDSFCHFALGRVYQARGEYDRAIPVLKTAVELNPNSPFGYYGLGTALAYSGRAAEAIEPLNHCFRLSPLDPVRVMFFAVRAYAYFALGRHDEAVEDGRMAASLCGDTFTWPFLVQAAAYAAQNKMENASDAMAEARRRLPGLSVEYLRDITPGYSTDNDRYLANLVKAGLPEK